MWTRFSTYDQRTWTLWYLCSLIWCICFRCQWLLQSIIYDETIIKHSDTKIGFIDYKLVIKILSYWWFFSVCLQTNEAFRAELLRKKMELGISADSSFQTQVYLLLYVLVFLVGSVGNHGVLIKSSHYYRKLVTASVITTREGRDRTWRHGRPGLCATFDSGPLDNLLPTPPPQFPIFVSLLRNSRTRIVHDSDFTRICSKIRSS